MCAVVSSLQHFDVSIGPLKGKDNSQWSTMTFSILLRMTRALWSLCCQPGCPHQRPSQTCEMHTLGQPQSTVHAHFTTARNNHRNSADKLERTIFSGQNPFTAGYQFQNVSNMFKCTLTHLATLEAIHLTHTSSAPKRGCCTWMASPCCWGSTASIGTRPIHVKPSRSGRHFDH